MPLVVSALPPIAASSLDVDIVAQIVPPLMVIVPVPPPELDPPIAAYLSSVASSEPDPSMVSELTPGTQIPWDA